MPPKSEFRASRYVHYFLYLGRKELSELFPEGYFVILGKVEKQPILTKKEFINGSSTSLVGFSFSEESFNFIPVGQRGKIAKQIKPIIEIKPFTFLVTSDGKLLENTHGKDAVSFGFCISYPSLFESEREVLKTKGIFKEAEVFAEMRAFIRKRTVAPKVFINEKREKVSFRIGKEVLEEGKKKLEKIEGLKIG